MKSNDLFKIDFIGIGFPKCGTTSIARLLERHPEICLSAPKEVQYFNPFKLFHHRNRKNNNFEKDLNWYKKHWNHRNKEKILGEFSPQYIYFEESAHKIINTFPAIKLIVCLRNPAHFAFSFYNMITYGRNSHFDSFAETIRNNEEFLDHLNFAKHLSKYLTVFDREKIHFVVLEEFSQNAEKELIKIFNFLNVDSSLMPEFLDKKHNSAKKSVMPFMIKFEKLTVKILVNLGGSKLINMLKKLKIVQIVQKFHLRETKGETIEKEDYLYILSKFNDEIQLLENKTGIDLSIWNYKILEK